jgi:hypothetical protein
MTDYRTKAEKDAARHFQNDVKDYKLVALREDGLFRHVEFVAQQGFTHVILVVWPYNLLVAGSHGSFHFQRYGDDTEDMFNWLRGSRVNPSSWASKLVNGRDSVTEYDRSLLEKEVKERVAEAVRDKWAPKGLRAAVREEILDSGWLDDQQNALRLVSEFEHGATYRTECSCGASEDHDSRSSAVCWNVLVHKDKGDGHKVSIRQTAGFDFDGFEEWNVRSLTYHYLWACNSAVWGISQYDAMKAAPAEAVAS